MTVRRGGNVVLAALVLLACGCGLFGGRGGGRRAPADDALRAVDTAEAAAQKDPSLHWRAGWMRYVVASDSQGARRHWEQAVRTAGPGKAWALAGLAELAEDRLDTQGAVRLWLESMREAPQSPSAELCGVRLLDVEGESPAVDDLIGSAAASLRAPVAPRAARLLREAAARIAVRRAAAAGDVQDAWRAWAAVGAVQRWRVAGPFAALRLLDLARPTALDGAAQAVSPERGPAGPTAARALEFPDADVGFDNEPGEGDLFYAASDVTLARGGDYLAWVEVASALELRIDGAAILSRVPYPRESLRAQAVPVRLSAGGHHVLVRWARPEGPRFRLALVRADGDPSDASSAAPAEVRGWRSSASCALGTSCAARPAWTDASDLRAFASSLRQRDEGDPLAPYLEARAALGDDRAAARDAVERLVKNSAGGAPALVLRGQQLLRDSELPERIGRARALADVLEAARKAPQLVRARVIASALERDSERYDDAAQDLDRAEASLREAEGPDARLPGRLLVSRARLLDARGSAQAAKAKAEEALRVDPGRCDALQLSFDVSRREGAVTQLTSLVDRLAHCPDSLASRAQVRRERGDLAGAEELLARAAALYPASPARLESLSEVQSARKRTGAAIASAQRAAALTPRSPEPLRRLAGLQELAGDRKAALETRRRALQLAPGDLGVRQQVAFDEGTRVLAWSDRDALALAKAPPAHAAPRGASAVRILDYGAAEVYPDGGIVERVHTLARVLDKKGIGKFGEAQIPGDAQVVHLRTIKPNGRVLEPEAIPEKEGISLPGLEPGDAVEIDYLRGIAPRGPEMPGWALSGFFFRDDETPMAESTYEVRAAAPFEADSHNLSLARDALQKDGSGMRFRHSVRDVPPLLGEPHQPAEAEMLPWVQLGTGAGQAEAMRSVADWALLRARPTSSTEELAREAKGSSPRDTAQKIFAAVALAVRGRSQSTDFSTPAAHVLAQGRGNRLLVLKSALAAAGIPSHIVLVRPFGADPAKYRFARGELYSYAVLRIELPDRPAWVDATYRLAPFDQLPSFARGQPAWVVPEPGEDPVETRTPPEFPQQQEGRALTLDLELDGDGGAIGTGRDEHRSFEAASLKDALDRLDSDQRKQAVEAMIARGLRGASLETLATEHEADVGGTAVLVYGFHAPFGRKDGARLFVPASPMPARLARRWAEKGDRNVPLLVDSPERVTFRTTIALPPAMRLAGSPEPVKLRTPFGEYAWSAKQDGRRLVVEESMTVAQQRIAPADYPAFAAFARAVDDHQAQELVVE